MEKTPDGVSESRAAGFVLEHMRAEEKRELLLALRQGGFSYLPTTRPTGGLWRACSAFKYDACLELTAWGRKLALEYLKSLPITRPVL